MATTSDIVKFLRPHGGYVIYDNDIHKMLYDEGVTAITQTEYDSAAKIIDAKIVADNKAQAAAKAALLARLGITADEAALLLG